MEGGISMGVIESSGVVLLGTMEEGFLFNRGIY